jgi:signal transduction histidine kinase
MRSAELQEAREELESKVEQRTATLRRLSSQLIHVRDEEHRRLARHLHDNVGQYLIALGMKPAPTRKGVQP